jgi:hypothetical protein
MLVVCLILDNLVEQKLHCVLHKHIFLPLSQTVLEHCKLTHIFDGKIT